MKELIEKAYANGNEWKVGTLLYNECRERDLDGQDPYPLHLAAVLGHADIAKY